MNDEIDESHRIFRWS